MIVNITGNVICGQGMGYIAKVLSERFGKYNMKKKAFSSSGQIPSLAVLLPGKYNPDLQNLCVVPVEFVGMVADETQVKIR